MHYYIWMLLKQGPACKTYICIQLKLDKLRWNIVTIPTYHSRISILMFFGWTSQRHCSVVINDVGVMYYVVSKRHEYLMLKNDGDISFFEYMPNTELMISRTMYVRSKSNAACSSRHGLTWFNWGCGMDKSLPARFLCYVIPRRCPDFNFGLSNHRWM